MNRDLNRLFADLNECAGKDRETVNSNKNLIENYLYESGFFGDPIDDKKNMDAGYNAYVQRAMFVESLLPEKDRMKVIFGIPVEEALFQCVKYECEANAYLALKEMWLDLLDKEKELLKKEI